MTKPKRIESGVYELEIESVKYRIVKTVDWVIYLRADDRIEDCFASYYGNESEE